MSIFSPTTNPLFLPTLFAFGGALTVGLAGVVAAERGRIERIRRSVLFQRWRTWALTAPIFGLAVQAGAGPTAGLIAAATAVGLLEYASLTRLSLTQRWVLIPAGVTLVVLPVATSSSAASVLLLTATVVALALVAMRDTSDTAFQRLSAAVLGLAYVALLFSYAVQIVDKIEGGAGLLIALGMGIAVSDVSAFVFGKALGNAKLAPRLSPNKTWAGAAGNVLGAYIAFSLMSFALPELPLITRIALPGTVAIAGIAGDLFESFVKRSFGAKDAAGWLPGFGGLLDRIDSLLFALPVAFYLVSWSM